MIAIQLRERYAACCLALLIASACKAASVVGPPARLAIGTSDTLVVNNLRPVPIPVRVLDAAGQVLPVTGVRFEWTAGIPFPVSAGGVVTCTQAGDATLRASLGNLATTVLLRCRPVHTVRIRGPVQFLLGDTAQALWIEALDQDGRPVDLAAATVEIFDSTVAALEGQRLRPRSAGGSLVEVRVGDQSAGASVHVYQPLTTLDGLRPEQRFVAVRLRLGKGEERRWQIPAGEYMLTMLPYEDEGRGLRFGIEGANCDVAGLTVRRYTCLAPKDASIFVYHPSERLPTELSGVLLLRRTGVH